MNSVEKTLDRDELFKGSNLFYTILISILWSNDVLMSYIKAFIQRLPLVSSFSNEIILLITCVCLLLCLNKFLINIKGKDIVFVLACLLVYFSHYFLFPENQEYIWAQAPIFIGSLMVYFIGVSYEFKNKSLFKFLYYVSIVNTICFIVYNLFIHVMDDEITITGGMFVAYTILPHLCLIFYFILKKANIINITVFTMGVILLFSLGNRGSVLCLAIFVALTLIFIYGKTHPLILTGIIIAIFIVVATPLFDIIFEFMYNFAKANGLSTRIFIKYMEGDLADGGTRNIIQSKMITAIKRYPLLGSGIMSDRRIVGYAHNIVLEFLLNFGVIFGSVLIVAIFALLLKVITKSKDNKDILALVFIFFCRGVVHLFLSGSYLQESNLFLFIGLCFGFLRYIKQQNASAVKQENSLYTG